MANDDMLRAMAARVLEVWGGAQAPYGLTAEDEAMWWRECNALVRELQGVLNQDAG